MNICFLDNNKISYDYTSLDNENIRGAEKTLINLSLKLNKLGHKITVLNHTNKKILLGSKNKLFPSQVIHCFKHAHRKDWFYVTKRSLPFFYFALLLYELIVENSSKLSI